ncbi:hypothetical protein BBK36DRAFT_1141192 [Trichoderma citrinoviride]|uniref:Uncharacterized protein n=1 Tax=Trichoderma citrinoviride TaxID=58853 RepID=A0A2T4BAJ8_9HYPO|nr:hypothetical protein BBK36DRAFT_1141192 [Trichoderma citrinoviride]PTB66336.1 hypothetical protein BBK36DRAFT_1141192 [Trichoderma citrinoviride]
MPCVEEVWYSFPNYKDSKRIRMSATGCLSPSMISIPPDIVIDGTGQQRDAALDSGEAEVVPADSLPSPMPTPPETAIDSRQQSQDVLRKALEEGELPADLFTADHHWLSVLLSKADISMTIKAAIEEFQHSIQAQVFPQSSIDVMAFSKDEKRQSWHSHCPTIDQLWDQYLEAIKACDDKLDTSFMCKPSGPYGAVLYTQWHYPTFNTKKSHLKFGHVLDTSNNSLALQSEKIGTPSSILCSDMLPIREDAKDPGWETRFPKWKKMAKLSIEFNYTLMRASPIVLLVGSSCLETFDKCLQNDKSISLTKVRLFVPGVFQIQPFFYVAYRKNTQDVQQLIFFVQHSSHFIYAIANIQVKRSDLFTTRAIQRPHRVSPEQRRKNLELARKAQADAGWPSLVKGRQTEKERGYPSLRQGTETQRQNGFPSLVRGRQTNKDRGYPELVKGLQTQRENGFPSLVKGRQVNKERGYPGFAKSREAFKKDGWSNLKAARKASAEQNYPGLVKARQVLKEKGYPNVAKGHQTMAKSGYQGLAKGRQTMAKGGYQNLVKARQVHMEKTAASRLARLRALWESFEVQTLISKPLDFFTEENVKEMYLQYTTFHGWATPPWEDLSGSKRFALTRTLKEISRDFRDFEALWATFQGFEATKKSHYLKRYAIWPWEETSVRSQNPNPAITIFWPGGQAGHPNLKALLNRNEPTGDLSAAGRKRKIAISDATVTETPAKLLKTETEPEPNSDTQADGLGTGLEDSDG